MIEIMFVYKIICVIEGCNKSLNKFSDKYKNFIFI